MPGETLTPPRTIEVNGWVYALDHRAMHPTFNGSTCPYCHGRNFQVKSRDEVFQARIGCLDCDVWLEPVRNRR